MVSWFSSEGGSASGGESKLDMYFVYVLRSIIYETRYIGSTRDIVKRVKEHNSGKVRYTKGRRPWKLVYQEEFGTRSDARKRELYLKSGQGRNYLDTTLRHKDLV